MNLKLKKYLESFSEKNATDKTSIITNIGLVLEKNNSQKNPTDYFLLLPYELINLYLTEKDKNELIDYLLSMLKDNSIYSSQIVWSIGKTFDEKFIESMLDAIVQTKQCDDETFEQILFIVDVIQNERINKFVQEIKTLKQRQNPL